MIGRPASTWEYVDDRLDAHSAAWRASLFTTGNGHLGTRGTFEEGYEGQEVATFINGLFVSPPGGLPVLAAVPDWTGIALTVDGEQLRMDRTPPAGFERRLDMRTGIVTRTIVWKGEHTGVVKIVFRRTASMEHEGLVALDVAFTALSDSLEISFETGIDSTVSGPYGSLWRRNSSQRVGSAELLLEAESIDGVHELSTRCWVTGVDSFEFVDDPDHPRLRGNLSLDAGQTRRITKLALYSDTGSAELAGDHGQLDFDDVVRGSIPAWDRRWATSRIDIGGDPNSERAVRFAAYQLISASPSADTNGSIGARLLTGYGYRHHVFWDTDIYVIPYLTVTQPDLAAVHLRYRHRGLAGARRKARDLGYAGAFYAWESADTGDDVTPMWGEMPDGEKIRIWTGELQAHITACVGWAADNYHRWTSDDDFMRRFGVEMIADGGHFWASRVESDEDGAHIRNVIGPNEYHVPVNDSHFTNAMAAWQLRQSVRAIEWLESEDPAAARDLLESIGVTRNALAGFSSLAGNLVSSTNPNGVIEEREGFFELEQIDLASFAPTRVSLHGLLGDKRTQEVQLVKQADVVMALTLLEDNTDRDSLAASFDYYAAITDHGSSLSLAMHSLAASNLGRPTEAFGYFTRAIAIDHSDAMERGGQGIHAAAQGGILQATLFGFAGLRLGAEGPEWEARLPHHWESLGFSFVHNGRVHDEEVQSGFRSSND